MIRCDEMFGGFGGPRAATSLWVFERPAATSDNRPRRNDGARTRSWPLREIRESKSVRDRGRSKRETKCTSVTLRILIVCMHWEDGTELLTVNQRRDAVEGNTERFQRRERRS